MRQFEPRRFLNRVIAAPIDAQIALYATIRGAYLGRHAFVCHDFGDEPRLAIFRSRAQREFATERRASIHRAADTLLVGCGSRQK